MAGCKGDRRAEVTPSQKLEPLPISQHINASIYIDGTASMYGYVNYPGSTIYTLALQDIERTIKTVWKEDLITYFKFGDTTTELARKEFIAANQVAFYNQVNTNIGGLVQELAEDHLNIIVTDLFQTDQDLDSLLASLKSKYLVDNRGVGIIGIKSHFNGKIYDVGKNAAFIEYASGTDEQTYRPFYMIVLGKEADVKAFMFEFSNKIHKSTEMKMIYIGENVADIEKVEGEDSKKEKNVSRMAELESKEYGQPVIVYRLQLNEKASGATIEVDLDRGVGNIPKQYEYKTNQIEFYEKKKKEGVIDSIKRKILKKEPSAVNEANEAVKISTDMVEGMVLPNDETEVQFSIRVHPEVLDKKTEGTYIVHYSLIATKRSYLDTLRIFDDWNFDDSELTVSSDNLNKVGNRTLNINRFMEGLGMINYETNLPGLHNGVIVLEGKD